MILAFVFALAPFTGVEKELDEVLNLRSVYISSATLGMYNSGSVSSIHHQLDTFISLAPVCSLANLCLFYRSKNSFIIGVLRVTVPRLIMS